MVITYLLYQAQCLAHIRPPINVSCVDVAVLGNLFLKAHVLKAVSWVHLKGKPDVFLFLEDRAILTGMGISTLGSALLLVDPGHGKPARSHSEDLRHSVRGILSQRWGLWRRRDKNN